MALGVVFLKRPSVKPRSFCSNKFSVTRGFGGGGVGGGTQHLALRVWGLAPLYGVAPSRPSRPRCVDRGSGRAPAHVSAECAGSRGCPVHASLLI